MRIQVNSYNVLIELPLHATGWIIYSEVAEYCTGEKGLTKNSLNFELL